MTKCFHLQQQKCHDSHISIIVHRTLTHMVMIPYLVQLQKMLTLPLFSKTESEALIGSKQGYIMVHLSTKPLSLVFTIEPKVF